jgi:hypothetical protein
VHGVDFLNRTGGSAIVWSINKKPPVLQEVQKLNL